MLALAARHLLRIVLVLLLISFLTLVFLDLLPGDTATALAGPAAQPEVIAAVREDLGLNRSFPRRYVDWVNGIVSGDLGRSPVTKQPVWDVIKERIPITFELAGLAFFLSLALAIPLGVYAASRPSGWLDRGTTFVTSGLLAMPSFLSAILLALLLSVTFRVFPVTGWVPFKDDPVDNLYHLVLPVLALALPEAAVFTRLLRNDMAATLNEDYIVAARARGLPSRRLLFGHALRPSSFTLITVAGVAFARLLGGSVIVESIFALPGIGQQALQSIQQNDFVLVRGVVLVTSSVYLVINALIDLAYPLLDPRARVAHR